MTMDREEEIKALLLLNRLGARDRRFAQRSLENGSSPFETIEQITEENRKIGNDPFQKLHEQFDPERECEQCLEKGVRFVTLLDPGYPPLLRQIPDPPILLYSWGQLEESDRAAIAVVGSRHPSFYGLEQARKFARDFAQSGITVVSGLAQGIDRAAHEAVMEISYGRTIAVLGCGIDVVYPRESRSTYERILEHGGVIMSEFPLGTKPFSENFPRRNRIISGISLGVLVVEAHSRSGSLITAHEAADQGREVFAIPGPVDQLTSRGTHRLIREGACLVESPWDVLEVLAPMLKNTVLSLSSQKDGISEGDVRDREKQMVTNHCIENFLKPEEKAIVEILSEGPLAYDELVSRCSFSPAATASIVTGLELRGEICRTSQGCFVLASASRVGEN